MNFELLEETEPWQWPGGVAEEFIAVLRDRNANPNDRRIAAEIAGNIPEMTEPLADALIAVLEDRIEPELLRYKAAISLGPLLETVDTEFDLEPEFPDDDPLPEEAFHKAVAALRSVYDDQANPKVVRRRALEAAVRAPADWHEEAIRAAYASKDPEWMLTAVFCMGYIPGFEHEIIESLNSQDPEIKYQAVRAAGEMEVHETWGDVVALAENPSVEKDLRLAAIEALGSIQPGKSIAVLDDLMDSSDADIVAEAEEALDMAQVLSKSDDDDEDEDEDDDDEDEDDEDDEDEDDEEDDDEKDSAEKPKPPK